jgi:hypothetical protein
MTNERLKQLRDGALFALGVGILSAIFIVVFLPGEEQPDESFTVVGHYKGCDVVRYTTNHLSSYHYFLHCEK